MNPEGPSPPRDPDDAARGREPDREPLTDPLTEAVERSRSAAVDRELGTGSDTSEEPMAPAGASATSTDTGPGFGDAESDAETGSTPGDAGAQAPRKRSVLERLADVSAERFSRGWLLVLLAIVMLAFLWMVRFFATPVILAAVFTVLAYPIQQGLVRFFRGRRGLAAVFSLVLLITGVLIPAYITANLLVQEVLGLYQTALPEIDAFGERANAWAQDWSQRLEAMPIPLELPAPSFEGFDWQGAATTGGNLLANLINRTSRGGAQLLASLFIILFTMFYFFRDGEAIVARLRYLSPLDEYYEELLIGRLISISRATLRGSLILGIIQGGIGAVSLAIAGVQAPFLWGVTMVIFSVIPILGTWIVMYPFAIVFLLQGKIFTGLFLIVMTMGVISTVDNVLRPRLVGRGAGMHDLLVFFATLGGIATYGVMGFIVGPIIAAFFVALLDIYSLEFQSQLEHSGRRNSEAAAAE